MASTIHQLEQQDKRGRWFVATAILLSISVLTASWIGLFTFMSATAAHGSFLAVEEKYIPEVDGEALNLPDLSQVSRVYASDGTLLAELHDGRVSEPIRYEEYPERVIHAVLAAEDSDFFEHQGIDWSAIVSAAIDNLSSDTTRGGSTITQQVVKKTFVGDELTLKRKIREAVTAIELERRYSKEQILEFYMNSVYFGASAYGINAAAHEFFRKDLAQLSIAEAATLAVLPRNPTTYNPRRNAELTVQRRNDVITEMVDSGFITAAEGEAAKEEPMFIAPPETFASPADHVVAYVKQQLLSEPEFAFLGATREQRKHAIFGCPADDESCEGGGGLEIRLTIDLDMQNAAQDILEQWLPLPSDPEVDVPTGAIASVDNVTGAIIVMASGLPFDQEQYDLAVQGKRNPGSSFKPFALVAAMESGVSLNSWWDSTSPKEFECPYTCSSRGNIWEVSNAGGSRGGLMRLFDATYNSVNVVYAGVALDIGAERIVDTAHRMGITTDLPAVPSITLGAGAVSPLEMASAYTNFATNGLWAKPYIVDSITSPNGDVIYQHQVDRQQVIDASIAAAARQPLEIVPVSGTAPRANIGRPQGGKTGTHQNFTEAWFVGFVPQYSTAVWVGYPDEQTPLRNVLINGQRYDRVFGGSVPAPIWKQFMERLLVNVPVADFPADPDGVSVHFRTPTTTVPSIVGMTEDEAKKALLNAHLNASIEEVASLEPAGTVIGQSPEAGAEIAEGSAVTVEVSTGLPPEAPLPLLIGLTQQQVNEAILLFEEETEITVVITFRFVDVGDPKDVGKVVRTNPAGGSLVSDDTVVVVDIGEKVKQGDD